MLHSQQLPDTTQSELGISFALAYIEVTSICSFSALLHC